MQDIINGRCGWCGTDELYVKYHDEEWGRLVTDDKTLFEFLVLESSQAGLSWITILKKREGYRKAFCNFDAIAPHSVSRWANRNAIFINSKVVLIYRQSAAFSIQINKWSDVLPFEVLIVRHGIVRRIQKNF